MCLFCKIQHQVNNNNPEDTIIDVSKHFYAKPALGQFVEGYVLINSKEHYNNFAVIDNDELYKELDIFITSLKINIKKIINSNFIIFEHGSLNKFCKSSLCNTPCIDHAHLHLLPFDIDLTDNLKNKFQHIAVSEFKEIRKYKNKSYIYYENSDKRFIFFVEEHIPSQYLRRLICKEINIENFWNWAEFPFRERIIKFVNDYVALNKRKK